MRRIDTSRPGAADHEGPPLADCVDKSLACIGWQELPLRGMDACRSHPVLLARAAAGEVSAHAACIHCCRQELPPARHQQIVLASIVAARSCRRRGQCMPQACCGQDLPPASSQELPPVLLAGAAAGEAPAHAAGMQCCWQELPPARRQRMPLAFIVAGRSCLRRGTSALCWHPLLLAGAAAGQASAHVACMQCCRQ